MSQKLLQTCCNFRERFRLEGLPFVAFMSCAILLVLATAGSYGIGWDEYCSSHYGELVLEYFKSGGASQECNSFYNLYLYGPTFDLVAACVYQFVPSWKYELRHLFSAVFGLLTFVALMRLGRFYGDALLGLIAVVALALMPRFYGHSFINPKDIPFACGIAWMMCLAIEICGDPARRTWRQFFHLACVIGLTTSIRAGGWLIIGMLLPSLVVTLFLLGNREDSGESAGENQLLGKSIMLLLVSWALMVLPWPWAHVSPFVRPLVAIRTSMAFHAEFPVLFEGTYHSSLHLPRYYLLKMIGVTTPISLLFFAFVGMLAGTIQMIRRLPRHQLAVLLGGLLWLTVPVLCWTLVGSNIYDGIRHFLFVLPALAFWVAYGVIGICKRLRQGYVRVGGMALVAFLFLLPAMNLIQLHPFQMTYYNEFVGGTKGADRSYETDYWATGLREAAEWVNQQSSDPDNLQVYLLANRWNRLCFENFTAPNVSTTLLDTSSLDSSLPLERSFQAFRGDFPRKYTYFVAPVRANFDQFFADCPTVYKVQRGGATFAVVKAHPGSDLQQGRN